MLKMMFKDTFILLVILLSLFSIPSYASVPTTGKGMWIWEIWNCEDGNLDSAVERLKGSGVTWVAVKLGDSNSPWDRTGQTLYAWASRYGGFDAVTDTFHNNGIKVYGWQYVYGKSEWSGAGVLSTEADVTNEILDLPGIDGFIIDTESEFEVPGMAAAAAKYLSVVRSVHPKSFVALTSFARIDGHPMPWTIFLAGCNANMPQAYWALRPTSVQYEFDAMKSQFETWEQIWIDEGYISSIKPIVPIGCENSQSEDNYRMKYGDIQHFCDSCQAAGYVGVSLWDFAGMDTMNWRDYAASWKNIPPAAPLVTSTIPAVGDSLEVFDSLRVDFNTPMDAASVDTALSITPRVDGRLIMNPDFTKWTFAHDSLLAPSTSYTIAIDTSAVSLFGTHLSRSYSFSFPTHADDSLAPKVIAVFPESGGISVSKAYVEFILNEPVHLGDIGSYISFVDSTGGRIAFTKDLYEITQTGLSIVAIHSQSGLTPGMKYTVTLAPGVTSYYGVSTTESYSTTFTVSAEQSSSGEVIGGVSPPSGRGNSLRRVR